MSINLTFTRYLYNYDEVILTGLECLLKHTSIEECYFWFYEIYSSGYVDQIWNILWKIYYDFYAEKNGYFERKMKQYYRGWEKNKSFKQVMNVLRTLHTLHKSVSGRVFMMRVFYCTTLRQILSAKNRNKLKSSDRKYEILKYGLEENKDPIVGYYLKKLYSIDNEEKLKELIKNFKNEKIILNDNYDDKLHQLYYHSIKNVDKNKKNVSYNVSSDAVEEIKQTDDTCYNESKYGKHINTVYKTLALRRKYGISSNIGCFKLARDSVELNNEFWYHWEYYAYRCPLWKSRFDKYKIKVDHEKKEIVFEDVDEYEEFYELYQYEPDEQSKETQEKSTKVLKKRKLNEWLKDVEVDVSRQEKIRKKLKY
tara:strand:- start:685 stop:1785 length:1101 start_codon:yes stop_codon:yes gene_type:complete